MSHLSNALATAQQLYDRNSKTALPPELQDSIRYSVARLTQAAGILLRLPQDVAAQAIVTLHRYMLAADMMEFEFSDLSAASTYLTAKISASPRSLRSITNVYAYLQSPTTSLSPTASAPAPESYYLSESAYISRRTHLLHIEGQILAALGFTTHVALPHPLAITYLQTLDVFNNHPTTAPPLARRTIQYLNTALLSPQLLYLTHQPSALATAAIYLAARDVAVKLPDREWWEVFDTEREELGFLALAMKSLEGWVRAESVLWGEGGVGLTREGVRAELRRRVGGGEEDEEEEMMRLLDEKVG